MLEGKRRFEVRLAAMDARVEDFLALEARAVRALDVEVVEEKIVV